MLVLTLQSSKSPDLQATQPMVTIHATLLSFHVKDIVVEVQMVPVQAE
jgi:hypothetical protein